MPRSDRTRHDDSNVTPADDANFTKTVRDTWKQRLGANIRLLRTYGLPVEIGNILDKARVARNEIAHGVALGTEDLIETDAGRLRIL